jgi:hypothetical protein
MTVFRFIRDVLIMLACLCIVVATLALVGGTLIPDTSTTKVRIEQPLDVVPVPTPSCPPGIDGC